eukprot:scaffold35472_cov112-Isochrysis_galbana.AAC.1
MSRVCFVAVEELPLCPGNGNSLRHKDDESDCQRRRAFHDALLGHLPVGHLQAHRGHASSI